VFVVEVIFCVLLSYVYLLYCVWFAFFALDTQILARSQYSVRPATGHIDRGYSCFPCVYKQMLRWITRIQVATNSFSCSPADLNLVIKNFIILNIK